VLALCAIAVNPWSGSLLAFEEPENGVHPRRLELIERGRQIIVTTHSPLLCGAVLRRGKFGPEDIALLKVRHGVNGTEVIPLNMTGPLFKDEEIAQALAAGTEDGLFESLMLRGMLDE
jgi:predicted ATPase